MLLLTNGQMLNEEGTLITTDILVKADKIAKIGKGIKAADAKVIELAGKLVTPGLIDVHVHLREPGGEHKETIATGTAAAARGGYTLIAAMPNTSPVPDSTENLKVVLDKIKEDAVVRVIPYGSITANLKGEHLNDFSTLASDVFAFTDDGRGIQEAGMMYHAMIEAAKVNKPIVAHCEDDSLLFGGYLHDGSYAKQHNHKGILSASESIHIARDAILAKAAAAQYHVCHVSTKESVSIIRWAKAEGINITAEVSPHHLLLADKDIVTEEIANFKMNPPLRDEADRLACLEGILDGTIDIIATDHAPHTAEEKAWPIDEAPFGIVGLETAFPLMYTHFVKNGNWSLKFLVDRMTTIPAKIFNLPYGRLEVGAPADIAVFDLDSTYQIDVEKCLSKGKNTPFNGYEVSGETVMTVVNGEIVYSTL
ncbi:MAG: dihydroorotase [Defluviitaleaceae bacterium]|nr:dihydroorotase [Defluviitaleaceae bacterium]